MSRNFEHEGKTFEIREAVFDDRYAVKVFLDGKQVSPEYSASIEVGQDYFSHHKTRIVKELSLVAENDVRNGIYVKT
ncbi:hypothetical protein [Delftia sp.]|uniref:hypothetical protein n=1 Tax=Delftia sp. TaxID=1886637 RepID=UPI00258009EB|nr:hypothetical protein [Delftia sp.]MPT52925.1 hypothetical protein [Delftia sp.]